MLLNFVAIIVVVFWINDVNAQKESVGIGDQFTIKVTRSGIQNSSTKIPIQIGTNVNATASVGTQLSYPTSYQPIYADSSNVITLQTDKHLYKPTDSVKVGGAIWSGLIATVGGINTVSIQVRDNNDNAIYTGKSHINSDGSYSSDFQLPPDVRNGWFTLEAKADVNQDVLNTLTLKLQAGLDTMTKFVVMSPNVWPIKAEGEDFQVNIASISNVTNVNFDEQAKKISFIVTGDSGTEGVADVTIPKSLLSGDFTFIMDGQPIPPNNILVSDTQESTTFEINYHHSSHEIDIIGTNAVPEFPFSTLALGAAIFSILVFNLFANRIKRNTYWLGCNIIFPSKNFLFYLRHYQNYR